MTLDATDELAEIHAELRRLRAREASLRAELLDRAPPAPPAPRPGWPFRRLPGQMPLQ